MKFNRLCFNHTQMVEGAASPKVFTSCCVSMEGNLTFVRVQNSTRLPCKLGTSPVRKGVSPLSSISSQGTGAETSQRQIDLQVVDHRWLHLVLWANGFPDLLGLFIPDIRGVRALDALGWFARQHNLALQAYLAAVREVRTADEKIPYLLTAFPTRRVACLYRIEEDWQLLESIAASSWAHNILSDPLGCYELRAAGKDHARLRATRVPSFNEHREGSFGTDEEISR